MSEAERVTPPVMSDGTQTNGTIILASSVGSLPLIIPTDWLKGYIEVFADGIDAHVTFGDFADSVVPAAVTTVTAGVVVTHAAGECAKIPNGTTKQYDLRELGTRENGKPWVMHHIESALLGFVRIVRSSGKGTRLTP